MGSMGRGLRSGGWLPEIMITDVVMPQMRGPRVAEQMAMERPQTEVLFVSG